jgi:NAD(P)-dependent dehydrogenase (short-subunit alcohol dehydrogenase family)
MTEKKVLLITGAGRGMGVDIARAETKAKTLFAQGQAHRELSSSLAYD